MRHYKNDFKSVSKLALTGLFALVLVACDNSKEGDGSSQATAAVEEVYTGQDYTLLISAGEVKNNVAFGDITVGNPDAPITMIEYASMTCPHCATFHNTVLPEIKEKYVKTGKVKMVFRNFIRDRLDVAVSMVTRCYGPEKTFDLMNLFFQRQRQWAQSQDPLTEISAVARNAGISRLDLDQCLANTELQSHLLEMQKAGFDEGVSATPTFFINGEKQVGAANFETFREIFDDEL